MAPRKRAGREVLVDQNASINKKILDGNLPKFIDKQEFKKNYKCSLCDQRNMQLTQVTEHVGGRNHQVNLALKQIEENKPFALANKNGVHVRILHEGEVHDEPTEFQFDVARSRTTTITLNIENQNEGSVRLVYCHFTNAKKCMKYQILGTPAPAEVGAGKELDVNVELNAKYVGILPKSIFLKFVNENEEFYIVKYLKANCKNQIVLDTDPESPYEPISRLTVQRQFLEIVFADKPEGGSGARLEVVRPLKPFRINATFRSAVNHGLKEADDSGDETEDFVMVDRGEVPQEVDRLAADGPARNSSAETGDDVPVLFDRMSLGHGLHNNDTPREPARNTTPSRVEPATARTTPAARSSNQPAKHTDANVSKEITRIRRLLEAPLTFKNYAERWATMLRLEKMQEDVNVQRYNMANVRMRICREDKNYFELDVPGLAENRPSLLKGDCLFVSFPDAYQAEEGTPRSKEYEGIVHRVALSYVVLRFNKKFMGSVRDDLKEKNWNVRFVVPDHSYRLTDRAVGLVKDEKLLEMILFPTTNGVSTPVRDLDVYFNYDVRENTDQKLAVSHVVSGNSRPAPYLIFGPPGTGKTVTLVEAILQVEKLKEKSHIIACAPSNSAADLIAERLIKFIDKPHIKIFRMHARSRIWESVPETIKIYSNYQHGEYYYPPREKIQEYKIIVTTLATAGRLASAAFPEDHFTHMFIDECGQSTEPECLVALAGILNHKTSQVVLAGDPKQLGPIVHSPFAKEYGFGVSLLERLMRDNRLYQRLEDQNPPYNVHVMTELRSNYRSHPAILEVPNREFYHNDLRCCADETERTLFCKWSELPKKNFPIIFHGVIGEEKREGKSPSFFNQQEIAIVVEKVTSIMENRAPGLRFSDIGIITPYRKQAQKFKTVFKKQGEAWKDIRVGSVEEFQGGERKVIIVSTVRSNPDYGEFDTRFNLGFVANPKKFNVAITRAMTLLILVGNPHILIHDKYWRNFISYCQQNGALIGEEMDEIKTDDTEAVTETIPEVVQEMFDKGIDESQIRPSTPDQQRYYTGEELRDEDIVVVTTLDQFRQCKREVLSPGSVVAIDAEWTPIILTGRKQTLATLQLAVGNTVHLLDIPALRKCLPPAEWGTFFAEFFTREDVTKVGFHLANDLGMILESFGKLKSATGPLYDKLHPNELKSVCDLYVRSMELEKIDDFFLPRDKTGARIEPGSYDLSSLVRRTLGKPLLKTVQLSDWDTRPLLQTQVRYAALDAFVLLAIFEYVQERLRVLQKNGNLFKKLNNNFWNKLFGPNGRG